MSDVMAVKMRTCPFLPAPTFQTEKTCCLNPSANATPHPPRRRGGSLPRRDFHRVFLAALRDARVRKERPSLPGVSKSGRLS